MQGSWALMTPRHQRPSVRRCGFAARKGEEPLSVWQRSTFVGDVRQYQIANGKNRKVLASEGPGKAPGAGQRHSILTVCQKQFERR